MTDGSRQLPPFVCGPLPVRRRHPAAKQPDWLVDGLTFARGESWFYFGLGMSAGRK